MASGHRPSGGRGGFPVEIRTISRMKDRGRRALKKGMAMLREGYMSAVGPDMVDQANVKPGHPGYVCGQKQTLEGTDLRNFDSKFRK